MRLARLTGYFWIMAASISCAVAQNGPAESFSGQSQEPSRFSLDVAGKTIGHADYQIAPAEKGFHLQANYSFNTNGVAVKGTREASLDSAYGLLTDILTISASGTEEDVSVAVDAGNKKFAYKLKSSVQDIEQTQDLHPGTVILNNFDPSGVQQLVWLAALHPIPNGDYWALLAQGKGVYIPVKLSTAEAGEGTLDGMKVMLKHWRMQISGVDTNFWADNQNRLMEFAIPAQSVTYTREGFARTQTQLETTFGVDAVEERNVSFTSDGLKFPAVLALPKGHAGPFPIVVLVHGSGPQDADETIGPNKPFRDIAYGLAAGGVASLRYDKRTHFAAQTFQTHSDLDHEVVLDAVAALRYVVTLPEINANRVFLLGHSLGGTMAPVIAADFLAEKPGSVRGIIFMAAGVISIDQIIERQTAFQAKRHGATIAQLDQLQKQWQDIFATVRDTNTPPDRTLGIGALQLPAGYWRTWLQQDPAAELAKLGLPALVMRGFKDIQVSEKDFRQLEDANIASGGVGEQFDGLNHLFMPVTGDSTGDEYLQPGHTSPDAIVTIAGWIGTIR